MEGIRNDRRSVGFGRGQAATLAIAGLLGASWIGGTVAGTRKLDPTTGVSPLVATDAATAAAGGASWDLPNLDHERVDYWVERFTTSRRAEFARFLERMGRYQPMISAKLEEQGMPQDLIYLAMIESGFNPRAYSPAAASGLWQFIRETGERYGLEVNRAVDERNDPEKATDAALDYLQALHRQFGSWYLAAAAYNSGENRVARIMRQVTGSERGTEQSYYRIWNRLPRETRDYVPLMIAAARIAKEPGKYGFDDVHAEEPLAYDVVAVDPAVSLAAIARASGATVGDIQQLNPQLKLARTRNDRRSTVRIPRGTREAFALNWESAQQEVAAETARERARAEARVRARVRTYRVRKGDNLTGIARRHGVTVRAIKAANGLRGDRIRAGATLRIPARS